MNLKMELEFYAEYKARQQSSRAQDDLVTNVRHAPFVSNALTIGQD